MHTDINHMTHTYVMYLRRRGSLTPTGQCHHVRGLTGGADAPAVTSANAELIVSPRDKFLYLHTHICCRHHRLMPHQGVCKTKTNSIARIQPITNKQFSHNKYHQMVIKRDTVEHNQYAGLL